MKPKKPKKAKTAEDEAIEVPAIAPRKVGRQLTLTAEVIDTICSYVAAGAPKILAAQACGVARSTLMVWQTRALDPEEKNPLFVELVERMETAKAVGVMKCLALVQKKIKDESFHAATWLLTHRAPEHFAERSTVEQTGKDGGPIQYEQVGVVVLPAEVPSSQDNDESHLAPIEAPSTPAANE